MGQYLSHLNPETRKIKRSLEKLQLTIINSFPSSLIKLAFVYIYIYIYRPTNVMCVYLPKSFTMSRM